MGSDPSAEMWDAAEAELEAGQQLKQTPEDRELILAFTEAHGARLRATHPTKLLALRAQLAEKDREVERLRRALSQIAHGTWGDWTGRPSLANVQDFAHAALAPEPTTEARE
jgi:hypothetical protein